MCGGGCKREDNFHTFSHVSGQKKELAGPVSGAGSVPSVTGLQTASPTLSHTLHKWFNSDFTPADYLLKVSDGE